MTQTVKSGFRARVTQWQHCAGNMLFGKAESPVGEQFEGRERAARHLGRQTEQFQCRLGRCHPDPCDLPAPGLREELENRCGDDAQRPLRTDEEVLQIVAGIVFFQLAQIVQHLAGRQHDFETEAEFARIAIGQHAGAASVGRKIAADLAGALRGERKGKKPIRLICDLVQLIEDDAGFHRYRIGERIDLAYAVQPRERQHYPVAGPVRHLAANQSGVAALRHNRRPRLGGKLHNLADFLDTSRPQHQRGAPGIKASRFRYIRLHVARCAQSVAVPDDRREAVEQGRVRRRGIHTSA